MPPTACTPGDAAPPLLLAALALVAPRPRAGGHAVRASSSRKTSRRGCATASSCAPTSTGRRVQGRRPALLQRTPYSKNPEDPRSQYPPPRRGRLRRGRAGHARPLHVRRRGRAARRGRRRLRHGRVGGAAALRGRPRRDVRRQLQRHDAAAGGADASAAPGGALPVGVLRQPLRHGLPGRRVLPRRRPELEPRARPRTRGGARSSRRPTAIARLASRAEERKQLDADWYWQLPLGAMEALQLRRYSPGYFDLLAHPSLRPVLGDVRRRREAPASSRCRPITSPAGTTAC